MPRKLLQREIEREFDLIEGGKKTKRRDGKKKKCGVKLREGVDPEESRRIQKEKEAKTVDENVKRLLGLDAKVDSGAEEAIVKEDSRRKRTTDEYRAKKDKPKKKVRRGEPDGSSVFTEEDFAAVGEFLKTELVKKKHKD